MNEQEEIKRAIRLIDSFIKPNHADYDFWQRMKSKLIQRLK